MQILPVQYSSGVLSITGQHGSMEHNHTSFHNFKDKHGGRQYFDYLEYVGH